MTKPDLAALDDTINAAMQRLVEEGRAEWVTQNGERALRLTELGRAMIARRENKGMVQ